MAKNIISKDEVKNLAILANLDISGQADRLANLLSDTLEYVKTLEELDTSSKEETFQVTGLNNVFQEESSGDPLSKDEVLSNAHEEVNGLFSTKAVFER